MKWLVQIAVDDGFGCFCPQEAYYLLLHCLPTSNEQQWCFLLDSGCWSSIGFCYFAVPQFVQVSVYELLVLSQYIRIRRDPSADVCSLFHVHPSFPFCMLFLIFLWLNFLVFLVKISFLEIVSSCCAEVNCSSPFPHRCVLDNSILSRGAFFIKIRACIVLSNWIPLCAFSLQLACGQSSPWAEWGVRQHRSWSSAPHWLTRACCCCWSWPTWPTLRTPRTPTGRQLCHSRTHKVCVW